MLVRRGSVCVSARYMPEILMRARTSRALQPIAYPRPSGHRAAVQVRIGRKCARAARAASSRDGSAGVWALVPGLECVPLDPE